MIALPDEDWRDPEVLADWIELNAVAHGTVLRGSVFDSCKDSLLWSNGERPNVVVRTAHAQAVTDAWSALRTRRRNLGSSWPFDLATDTVTSRRDPVYAALLLMDVGRKYPESLKPNPDAIRTTFEHVVAGSLTTLFRGRTCRFGAPFPSGWPMGFPMRVSRLATEFALQCNEEAVPELSSKKQKDDKLDVVSRLFVGDEDLATVFFLVQCATGKNWNAKRGEPSLTKWREYIRWHAVTVRVLAIPWAVRPRHQLARIYADFDGAVVFDRWRIVAGRPNEKLDSSHQKTLRRWVSQYLSAFGSR